MNNISPVGLISSAILTAALLLLVGTVFGIASEQERLQKKCLIEMQDKSHKEAIEICKERVK